MKNLEQKALYYIANYEALSNAAEMIISHGEEGHGFEDEKFDRAYNQAKNKLAKQLNERADKFLEKYKRTGIEINTEVDRNY